MTFALPQPPRTPPQAEDPVVLAYLSDVYQYIQEIDHTLRGWQTFLQSLGKKPEITGIRDSNTALADLLTELETIGLLTDSTTAT